MPATLLGVWKHLNFRRKKQLLGVTVLMVITAFGEMISLGAVLPFITILVNPERAFQNPLGQFFSSFFNLDDPDGLLLLFTLFFIASAILAGISRIALLLAQTKLGAAIGVDLSNKVFKATLYQPYSLHISRNSSEILAGSQKAGNLVPYLIQPALVIVSSVLIIIAISTVLFLTDPLVTAATFASFASIYFFVITLTKRFVNRNSKVIAVQHGAVMKIIQEALGAMRDILLDGSQSVYTKIYRVRLTQLQNALSSNQFVGAIPRYALETLGIVSIAGLAYALTVNNYASSGFATAIPLLGALALGAQKLLPLLQQVYTAYIRLVGNQASNIDAIQLLDQPTCVQIVETQPPLTFTRQIEFQNLGFRYSSRGPWIWRNINFVIPRGNRVGFVGETGSGKSTLLDVAMGLLSPTEGAILIDSIRLDSTNIRAWQAHIAHVPQTIFLADTSIARNIAFGVPDEEIDLYRVRECAERAKILHTIESWSDGFNTMVGERGVRLSGGQRQRIGIARALYKRADVIMLDEATSALDNDTELGIMRTIEALGKECTVLIIAHRLSTLRSCDQIIDLANK